MTTPTLRPVIQISAPFAFFVGVNRDAIARARQAQGCRVVGGWR